MAKPIAVIVKGNQKYLNDSKIKPLAEKFYEEVKSILESNGFKVEFDVGQEFTTPRKDATVWVGHSKGIDRLRFAPEGVKTLKLETEYKNSKGKGDDEEGMSPDHYRLSSADIEKLNALN